MLRPAPGDSTAATLGRSLAGTYAFDDATWLACARAGLTGLTIDNRWGGSGRSLVDAAETFDAFAHAGAPPGLVFALGAQLWSVTSVIARFGNDEQRGRWLPGLCDGTVRGGHAMTEPSTGSDAFAMATTATATATGMRIDGAKTFVTNGPLADLFVVFATTDRAAGWAGVACFVVDRATAGLTVRSIGSMAPSGAPLAEVVLDGCEVDAAQRLGRGSGAVVFDHAMQLERSLLAAGLVGLAASRLAVAADDRSTRDRRAALVARLFVTRLLVRQAATRLDAGRRTTREASLAKLAAAELWFDVAALTAGGELDGADALADAVAGRIYSGTSELQRELLGSGLGL
jgi:alkylation response protein AidB-like acyl-CoA dehydrogenase